MAPITALLHARNDALRIGRCLETLYPCDRVLVVDHGSLDHTAELARSYGARVVAARTGSLPPQYPAAQYLSRDYLDQNRRGWILSIDPAESLSEGLAASLYELKSAAGDWLTHSVFLREETTDGWSDLPTPQLRVVPADWDRWENDRPVADSAATPLDGVLLRFAFP